jgi:hypothetical protein
MNRKTMLGFALVGALAMTAVVMADVENFDPEAGTGRVGKGDVQSAFGWNDARFQLNYPGVSFSVDLVETEKQACYTTKEPPPDAIPVGYRHHSRTATRDIDWEPIFNPQDKVVGISLIGYFSDAIEWSEWSDPVGDNGETFGNACPGFQPPGPSTHPAGAWIPESSVVEGLFVTFNGVSVKIWPED